jgi:MFS transporter, FSR family, fosmidomycin resistance protein
VLRTLNEEFGQLHMANMTDIAAPVAKARDFRVISLVGAAHFMSHVYILMLPPLFIYARAEYGATFEQLAYAMAAFGAFSAALQVPAGFIVDRIGSSALLIGGLALSATGVAIVGLIPAYWALILGYALLGIANRVYHPADYAILSHGVSAPRMAQAYSIHTFLGMAGQAVAPTFMLAMAALFGWRSGFLAIAVVTYAVAAVLLLQKDALSDRQLVKRDDAARKNAPAMERESRWKLLTSGPILRSFVFFALLTLTGSAMQNFTIVGFGALNGTPAAQASVGLTAFLVFNALGVLSGGFIADRFKHPMRIATIGLALSGVTILILAYVNFPTALFVAVLALSGFLNGVIMPSRDLIVRAVTPPGAFGVVFGFVTTGFNVSAVIAPLLYGRLMDEGQPRMIFVCAAIFTALSLTMANTARAKKKTAPAEKAA